MQLPVQTQHTIMNNMVTSGGLDKGELRNANVKLRELREEAQRKNQSGLIPLASMKSESLSNHSHVMATPRSHRSNYPYDPKHNLIAAEREWDNKRIAQGMPTDRGGKYPKLFDPNFFAKGMNAPSKYEPGQKKPQSLSPFTDENYAKMQNLPYDIRQLNNR